VDGNGDTLLIDSHGAPVAQAVWDLYTFTLGLTGAQPTLLERDNNIPAWPVLLAEAGEAEQLLRGLSAVPLSQAQKHPAKDAAAQAAHPTPSGRLARHAQVAA